MFRLSALFELADQEIAEISSTTARLKDEYKGQIGKGTQEVELNADSLRVYLETSELVRYYAAFIESLGVRVGPLGDMSRTVRMAQMVGIHTISGINRVLELSKPWADAFFHDSLRNTFGCERTPDRCMLDTHGIVTTLLIAAYGSVFEDTTLTRDLSFFEPERLLCPRGDSTRYIRSRCLATNSRLKSLNASRLPAAPQAGRRHRRFVAAIRACRIRRSGPLP